MQTTSAALFISLSLVVFGISYYYFTTRHKERMALIETGQSPDLFKKQGSWLYFLLTLGIVSLGIASGILTGALLIPLINLPSYWVMSGAILAFLGISLVICYFRLKNLFNKRSQ